MSAKSQTAALIIEQVSPIFNKKGYVATTMTDITNATKLTKGSVYGNFKNKEDLALHAFYYNVSLMIDPLSKAMDLESSGIKKLHVLTAYYRKFYQKALERGGCPILNCGVDTKDNNRAIHLACKRFSNKLITNLSRVIQQAIDENDLKSSVDSTILAKNIYTMIEGAVFMSFLNDTPEYLTQICSLIDEMIASKMSN